MASPFSISATTENSIANILINVASNVTDYAASNVMNYLNDSTECLKDNNQTKASFESLKAVSVTNHMAAADSVSSGYESPAIAIGVILAAFVGCCIVCGFCGHFIGRHGDFSSKGSSIDRSEKAAKDSIQYNVRQLKNNSNQDRSESIDSKSTSNYQVSIINERAFEVLNYQPTVVKLKETTV